MTFPEEDLDDLKKCKVGNCEIKMGEEGLKRIQARVDWSAPNAHEQANALIRQRALACSWASRSINENRE